MVRERIDCESLSLLTDHQLQELGISRMGDRIKLLKRAHHHQQRLQTACDDVELDLATRSGIVSGTQKTCNPSSDKSVAGIEEQLSRQLMLQAQEQADEDACVSVMSTEAAVRPTLDVNGGTTVAGSDTNEVTNVSGMNIMRDTGESDSRGLGGILAGASVQFPDGIRENLPLTQSPGTHHLTAAEDQDPARCTMTSVSEGKYCLSSDVRGGANHSSPNESDASNPTFTSGMQNQQELSAKTLDGATHLDPAEMNQFERNSLVVPPATLPTDGSTIACIEMLPTERSADHLGPHEEAFFELVLDLDFEMTAGKDDEYKHGIARDIALALGAKLDKVTVAALSAGSVVAHVVLKTGVLEDGRAPIDAIQDLEHQMLSPSSLLMTGKYTKRTLAIRAKHDRGGLAAETAAAGEQAIQVEEPAKPEAHVGEQPPTCTDAIDETWSIIPVQEEQESIASLETRPPDNSEELHRLQQCRSSTLPDPEAEKTFEHEDAQKKETPPGVQFAAPEARHKTQAPHDSDDQTDNLYAADQQMCAPSPDVDAASVMDDLPEEASARQVINTSPYARAGEIGAVSAHDENSRQGVEDTEGADASAHPSAADSVSGTESVLPPKPCEMESATGAHDEAVSKSRQTSKETQADTIVSAEARASLAKLGLMQVAGASAERHSSPPPRKSKVASPDAAQAPLVHSAASSTPGSAHADSEDRVEEVLREDGAPESLARTQQTAPMNEDEGPEANVTAQQVQIPTANQAGTVPCCGSADSSSVGDAGRAASTDGKACPSEPVVEPPFTKAMEGDPGTVSAHDENIRQGVEDTEGADASAHPSAADSVSGTESVLPPKPCEMESATGAHDEAVSKSRQTSKETQADTIVSAEARASLAKLGLMQVAGASAERHSSPPPRKSKVASPDAAQAPLVHSAASSTLGSALEACEENAQVDGSVESETKESSGTFSFVGLPNNLPDNFQFDLPMVFPTIPPVSLPSLSLFEKNDAVKMTDEVKGRKQTHATTQTSARGGVEDSVPAAESTSLQPVKEEKKKDAVGGNASHEICEASFCSLASVPQQPMASIPSDTDAQSSKRTVHTELSLSLDTMESALHRALYLPAEMPSFEASSPHKGLFGDFLGMAWASSPLKSASDNAAAKPRALEYRDDSCPAKNVPNGLSATLLDHSTPLGSQDLGGPGETETLVAHHQSSPPPRAVPKDAPAPISRKTLANAQAVSPSGLGSPCCMLGGLVGGSEGEEEEKARERRRQIDAECRAMEELALEECERLQEQELAKRIRAAQRRDAAGLEITLKSYDLLMTPRGKTHEAAQPRSQTKMSSTPRVKDSATVGVGVSGASTSASNPGAVMITVSDESRTQHATTAGAEKPAKDEEETWDRVAVAATDDASKAAQGATRAAQEARQHLVTGAGSLLGMLHVVTNAWPAQFQPPVAMPSGPRESASGRSDGDVPTNKSTSPPMHIHLQPAPFDGPQRSQHQLSSLSESPMKDGRGRRADVESRPRTSSAGRPNISQRLSTRDGLRWDVSASDWAAAGGQEALCSRPRSCSPPARTRKRREHDVMMILTSAQSEGRVARTALGEAAVAAAAAAYHDASDTGRSCGDDDGLICGGAAAGEHEINEDKEAQKLQEVLEQRWAGTDAHGGGHGVGGRGGGPSVHQSSPPSRVAPKDASVRPCEAESKISPDSSMANFSPLCMLACAE